jgi:hypothetical protein
MWVRFKELLSTVQQELATTMEFNKGTLLRDGSHYSTSLITAYQSSNKNLRDYDWTSHVPANPILDSDIPPYSLISPLTHYLGTSVQVLLENGLSVPIKNIGQPVLQRPVPERTFSTGSWHGPVLIVWKTEITFSRSRSGGLRTGAKVDLVVAV